MKPTGAHTRPTLRFHSGWRLFFRRSIYVAAAINYFLRKREYPLFKLSSAKGGALAALKIARNLKLQKMVQFNASYYTTPVLPRYPSRPYDHMVAKGGLNIAAAGTALKQQISMILLGITRRCDLHCLHCYERFNIAPEDSVPVSRWKEVIREIQHLGAGVVVLSGGEPMLRYDGLLDLLESGNKNLSEFHLHTSGLGVTPEKARELCRAGLTAAAVGLDDVDPCRHDALRGYQGSHRLAVSALRDFFDAGVFTYTNMCVTRDIVRAGDLWRYYDFVKNLDVGFIEMLEPRPCGGFAGRGDDFLLSDDDRKKVTEFFVTANTARAYRHYPLVYYVAYTEAPERMGCMMGGLSHLTIDSRGNVNPCVFLPVTFGNIMEEDFASIYSRMRKAIPRPVHHDCPSVTLAGTIWDRSQAGRESPVRYEALRDEWEVAVKD
jgi:MoaA/NifB/PqqE/SkfB family radical SAM enzyme